jgi:hypothetical protein
MISCGITDFFIPPDRLVSCHASGVPPGDQGSGLGKTRRHVLHEPLSGSEQLLAAVEVCQCVQHDDASGGR